MEIEEDSKKQENKKNFLFVSLFKSSKQSENKEQNKTLNEKEEKKNNLEDYLSFETSSKIDSDIEMENTSKEDFESKKQNESNINMDVAEINQDKNKKESEKICSEQDSKNENNDSFIYDFFYINPNNENKNQVKLNDLKSNFENNIEIKNENNIPEKKFETSIQTNKKYNLEEGEIIDEITIKKENNQTINKKTKENNNSQKLLRKKKIKKSKNKHSLKKQNSSSNSSSSSDSDFDKRNKHFRKTCNNLTLLLNGTSYFCEKTKIVSSEHPNTLGILKFIETEKFSENFYGQKLKFENFPNFEQNFEKCLIITPSMNKKYLIANNNHASNSEIKKEENDLLILHGKKNNNETFYYIMKLTKKLDNKSEYTLYRLKNDPKLVLIFKQSVGIMNFDRSKNLQCSDGNYRMINIHKFLRIYRELKKQKIQLEELIKDKEMKKSYNEKFNDYYLNSIKNECKLNIKKKKIENTKKENQKKDIENEILKLKIERKKYEGKKNETEQNLSVAYEELNKLKEDCKNVDIEIIKVNQYQLENKKIKKKCEENLEEEEKKLVLDYLDGKINENNIVKIINEYKIQDKKYEEMKDNIYCVKCLIRKRDIISARNKGCIHLMMCQNCHKTNPECPACKRVINECYILNYEENMKK